VPTKTITVNNDYTNQLLDAKREKKERKVILLGDTNVGKTTLMLRYSLARNPDLDEVKKGP
jgi:GTPase SAR1 family protein